MNPQPQDKNTGALDLTGRVGDLTIVSHPDSSSDGICIIWYPGQLGHSLWRSQEATLLRGILQQHPSARVADLGCGDGSFARALGRQFAWGLDPDPVAIAAARDSRIYDQVGCTFEPSSILNYGVVDMVISNSVLEHIGNLKLVLQQTAKILPSGGKFVFTVPLIEFTRHVTFYRGRKYANELNLRWSHRNLLEPTQWTALLEETGYRSVQIHQYQPIWVTGLYLLFSSRICSNKRAGAQLLSRSAGVILRRIVGRSLNTKRHGANAIINCERC
jgi:SAM-dependent methyltransferase